MSSPVKGYEKARHMRSWAERRGGATAAPDGLDRSRADTLASLADEWLRGLEERAYSPRTLRARRWMTGLFLRWAEERDLRRAEAVTKPVLESFQRALFHYRKPDGKPIGVMTQRNYLGALQGFFAWLCRTHRLPANPAADLELPRKPARVLPKSFSPSEIEAVLGVPDVADPLGVRDRAILELFYATGLRRAELVHADVDDLDFERGLLRIRQGKGGKDRVVPVGARALAWLGAYLDKTRPLLGTAQSGRALFLSGFGARLGVSHLSAWTRRVIAAAGIARGGSCHVFRHSCATHMLENGADIRHIQQLLGHARLDTTQIYTDVSIVQLREVHARTHPSARAAPAGGAPGGD